MIGHNINPVLKSHLVTLGYRDIEIYPINAYSSSKAPFITWIEFPSTAGRENFWMYEASLTYAIFDNDLSRAKDIAVDIQKYLNVGDDIDALKALMVSPEYRLCWSRMNGGGMFPPVERDGYTSITRVFDIGYIEI